MTFTAAGYDGTVDEVDWAGLAGMCGVDYGAEGAAGGLAVTGTSGTRTVAIAAGVAFGWGVRAVQAAPDTVSLAANATGLTRYDTIAVDFDWATDTTTVVGITGGATNQLVALTVNPGVHAQMPLAVVAVPNGATSLSAAVVYDHRAWSARLTSGVHPPNAPAFSAVWLSHSTTSAPYRPHTLYRWLGSAWQPLTDPAWTSLPLASGITSAGEVPAYRVLNGCVELRGSARKTSGAFTALASTSLGTLPAGSRPPVATVHAVGSSGGDHPVGRLVVGATGVVSVEFRTGGVTGVWLSGVRAPVT